jgi:hypothetical protein
MKIGAWNAGGSAPSTWWIPLFLRRRVEMLRILQEAEAKLGGQLTSHAATAGSVRLVCVQPQIVPSFFPFAWPFLACS